MVLKPYFPRVALAAVLSTEATRSLLPSSFSGVLCIVIYRTQVCKLQSTKYKLLQAKHKVQQAKHKVHQQKHKMQETYN